MNGRALLGENVQERQVNGIVPPVKKVQNEETLAPRAMTLLSMATISSPTLLILCTVEFPYYGIDIYCYALHTYTALY